MSVFNLDADSLEEDQATLCGSLLSRLDKQPDLVAKICEVLAELGKNGEQHSAIIR